MKRLFIGAALTVLIGFAGAASGAEPLPKAPPRAPWYKRLFGAPETPKPAPPVRRDPAKEAAMARANAEADLDRRQRVCDELRRIAGDKNDMDLWSKADELEHQAWEVYKNATAHLPCSRLVATHEERALDKHLGADATAAADKLLTPAISVPNRKSQASAIREVKP